MHRIIILVSIVFMALFSACVTELHPLYSDDVAVSDPAFIGTWISQDGKDTCIIQQAVDSTYDMTYSQEGVAANFEAHLVKLGDAMFLDTYPNQPNINNDYYKAHILLAHIISKIDIEQDSLQVAVFDDEWLSGRVDNGLDTIPHEFIDDNIVLTASTGDLQDFVTAHADDEDAFPNPDTYRRLK